MANQPSATERIFLRCRTAGRELPVGCFPHQRVVARIIACLMIAGLIATGAASAWAVTPIPQLDTDDVLKPLVDTSQSGNQPGTANQSFQQGNTSHQAAGAAPFSGSGQTLVLTGKIQTLQEAIASEKDVDWYAWYLDARAYLSAAGGLQCALGTPIKFYRDGRIEAMTFDSICRASLANRLFPLPKKSRLDALILPVRNGQAPPASPQELYSRINALQTQ